MISPLHISALAASVKAASGQSDPYWANVTNLLHFEGANGSTTITDQKGYTWTCSENAQISTARSAAGSSSARFDGTDDRITSASAASFYNFLHNGSTFTIELSFYMDVASSTARVLLTNNGTASANTGIAIYLSPTGQLVFSMTRGVNGSFVFNFTSASALTVGVFNHIAIVHDQSATNDLTIYVNGSLICSANAGAAYSTANATSAMSIGATITNTIDLLGNIDEIRITNGIARYTSNYTPSLPFQDS